jgi:hypothetical protein
MATYEIKPNSPERIRLIAEKLGIPADAPMVDWAMESEGEGGMLTVELKTRVTIEEVNAILNA